MSSEPPALRETWATSAPILAREDLLIELALLTPDSPGGRGILVVKGGPGTGKSSLLACFRERLDQAGRPVAFHALRADRGSSNRAEIVNRALAAQIEARFPACLAGESDAPRSLIELLSLVSRERLVPRAEQLFLIVDAVDEAELDDPGRDPLARIVPAVLPPGVVLLCSSEAAHPHLRWLEARDHVRSLDLDHPRWASSAERVCRALWEQGARRLGLDLRPALLERALLLGRGNALYAKTLLRLFHLDPQSRRPDLLPEGLDALSAQLRDELFGPDGAHPTRAAPLLGLLAIAREPLPPAAIREVLPPAQQPDLDALPLAATLLLAERSASLLQLAHPHFRALVRSALRPATSLALHQRLARTLAAWPPPDRRDKERRRYALRHAISHALEAADLATVERLGSDLDYLEVKCREEGPAAVEGDLRRAIPRFTDEATSLRVSTLYRALAAEESHLRRHPEALPGLVYNRLRSSGFSAERIETSFRFPRGLPAPRLRFPVRLDQGVDLTLTGHGAEVTACLVTPDGRRVLSASADKTLRLWDLESGELLGTLTGHSDEITACALDPSGKIAVSAAADHTVRAWSLDDGRALFATPARSERVNACVITPDGERVICAAEGDVIQIFDLRTGRCEKSLSGYSDENSARSLSPDGQTVFSSSYDDHVEVWSLQTGLLQTILLGHGAPISAVALTPDGARAVTASHDGTLRSWDLASGACLRVFSGHGAGVLAAAVSPDGKQLLSASADHRLELWDLETGKMLDTLRGHTDAVTACAFSPDGALAVSASADHTLKVWGLTRRKAASLGHGGPVHACALSPDASRVVSASADKTLAIWDAKSGALLRTLAGHGAGVNACLVTPDGKTLVSASYDRSLKLWNLASGALIATLSGHAAGVNAAALSPDGARLLSASYDKTLLLWDLASSRVLTTLSGHGDFVNACAIGPDGQRALSASADKTLRLWDLASGKTLITLEGHAKGVNACVLTPDGDEAISASYDKTLRIWDLRTGKARMVLSGHREAVTACALTKDGRTLVSASYDGSLRVWDLETGECVGQTLGLCPFHAVAVGEGLIAAGDAQGNVWMLDLPDPEELPPVSYARPSFLG